MIRFVPKPWMRASFRFLPGTMIVVVLEAMLIWRAAKPWGWVFYLPFTIPLLMSIFILPVAIKRHRHK